MPASREPWSGNKLFPKPNPVSEIRCKRENQVVKELKAKMECVNLQRTLVQCDPQMEMRPDKDTSWLQLKNTGCAITQRSTCYGSESYPVR